MKIALISDIHSNLEALMACCDVAMKEGAERFICLGDMVGYGPDPVATLDYLYTLPGFTAVLGNHDESMFSHIESPNNPVVQKVAEWTEKQLSRQHLDFLKSLPYEHVENGVTYVHASKYNPGEWRYIMKPEDAQKCMKAASTNLVFYGHIHIPMYFHELADNTVDQFIPEEGKKIPLNLHQRYVINVGSVGQPRDDNNKACFVIYDEEGHDITYHRVYYDYNETIRKIKECKINDYFAERLILGQ